MSKEMIDYEDIKMDCPITACPGKLEYIAYTAFHCKICKNGFSIHINTHRKPMRAITTTDACTEE